jgi:hypothetical protein
VIYLRGRLPADHPQMIARSEQLRDRLATFGKKGCTDVRQSFELFNEQLVINHE